jgi:hypothetical protein
MHKRMEGEVRIGEGGEELIPLHKKTVNDE